MALTDLHIHLEKQIVKFTLFGLIDRPGIAAEIFNRLNQGGINVELVVQTAGGGSTADLSIAVSQDDAASARSQLEGMQDLIEGGRISSGEEVALVTVEKTDLSRIPGIAARMFGTIARQHINIDLISTSLHCITCLIARDRAEEAHRALLDEFSD